MDHPHTAGLKVFTSNRLEILVEQLALKICDPLPSPFDKDIIVVQSKGMARWVAMELARLNGICANCLFPFPNSFLNYLCERLMPETFESSFFDPEALTFSIMKYLPICKNRPGYESVRAYLADDSSQVKLMQLSEKIAEIFDQYLIFRPGMIFEWESGKLSTVQEQGWQADLWQAMIAAHSGHHRAQIQKKLLEKIAGSASLNQYIPDRISAFGISYLPPFHLQILECLSKHVPVNVFLVNPCREYWGDLVTHQEARRIKKAYQQKAIQLEDLHLERGNRLIESMGILGRDFFDMILAMNCELLEDFEPSSSQSMLSIVQNDILNLIDPVAVTRSDSYSLYAQMDTSDHGTLQHGYDNSIQVHAAHSPMREVEILYDNLLAMFEASPDLLPKDIIVMSPDIETYAPFIYAVFDTETDNGLRIPFNVADRNIISASLVVSSFLAVLDLQETRFEISRVLSLLEYPAIRKKFGLHEQDIDVIDTWVKEVNIRWGRDGESRTRLGLPGFSENTWKAGVNRLLLGYAMCGNDRHMFSGILPYDNVEGDVTRCLGEFLEFLRHLFQFMESFEHSKTLGEWSTVLVSLVEKLFHLSDETEREIHTLKKHLGRLASYQTLTGLKEKIEFGAIKTYLQHAFKKQPVDAGFISGGVTFCASLPMRSIPFKVVCLVGLNNDNFPRDSRSLSFDLMAHHPLPGDRSRRNDDKYLFLEAIISAREKLYLSYVGQHIQDNAKIMPSVLLSELLEYVHERFGIAPDQAVVHHPLQAFSQEYFREHGSLVSYSSENFRAAENISRGHLHRRIFSEGLSEPAEAWRQLDIEALCSFFANPSRFLLQKRLGIFLGESKTLPDEKENFYLEQLEKYQVEAELVHCKMDGRDPMEMGPVLKARGILPYGAIGQYELQRLVPEVEQFVQRLGNYQKGRAPETIELNMTVDDFVIHGMLRDVYSNQMMLHRYGTLNARDMVRLWLYHLLRCNSETCDDVSPSVFISRNAVLTVPYVKNCRQLLVELLEMYWQGLKLPLPFFPLTAYAFARQRFEHSKSEEEALRLAKSQWVSAYGRGEYDDPYLSLCFSASGALDQRFMHTAESIFQPLMSHYRLEKA
jgi:exodeoxyribonuclease V gamma subunit